MSLLPQLRIGFLLFLTGVLPLLAGPVVVDCNNTNPTRAIGDGPDDSNISELTQCNATFITRGSNVGDPDWIMTALTRRGFGLFSQWDIQYAPAGDPGLQESNYTVNKYAAFVVSEPDLVAPNGVTFPGRAKFRNLDLGGAAFIFTYNPVDDFAPDTNIHFIQAYRQNLGGGFVIKLDGGTNLSPFYDVTGASGTADGNPTAYWFMDTPLDCENPDSNACAKEPATEGHSTDVQFNVLMAVDNGFEGPGDPHPGFQKVTIYGGYAWGYKYSQIDIPEPSYSLPAGLVLLGLAMRGTRRRLRRTPSDAAFEE